jgi:hypothetical protein
VGAAAAADLLNWLRPFRRILDVSSAVEETRRYGGLTMLSKREPAVIGTPDEFDDLTERLAVWVEEHTHRQDAAARQAIETAKLVTTFTAAIAATFVATALSAGDPSPLDACATVVVGLALAVVVRVVFIKPDDPATDVDAIIRTSKLQRWPEQDTICVLRRVRRTSVEANKNVAKEIRCWMFSQLALSAIASILAAVSIFV